MTLHLPLIYHFLCYFRRALSGGYDNFVLARKHYAMSLQSQAAQHNLRALYGVLYASRSAAQAAAEAGAADLSADG